MCSYTCFCHCDSCLLIVVLCIYRWLKVLLLLLLLILLHTHLPQLLLLSLLRCATSNSILTALPLSTVNETRNIFKKYLADEIFFTCFALLRLSFVK
jgi:hypothetical protein